MFWNRKRKNTSTTEVEQPVLPPCLHTWKDFPAYIKEHYEGSYECTGLNSKSILSVIEPYVCVHCKERKDITLYTETETNLTRSQHNAKREKWEQQYAKIIQPRIIVEDMINDEIYLDPVKLEIVDKLRSTKNEEKEQEKSPKLSIQPTPSMVEMVSPPSARFNKGMRKIVWRDDNEGKIWLDIL